MAMKLCLLICWHAVHAVTVVSAFASSSTTSTSHSTMMSPLPFRSKVRHHHHHHGVVTTTSTRLHLLLSIPRGGGSGTVTAAAASASSSVVATITSKLSKWTSTPHGTFNLVLALLGMSTAVLKLYNQKQDSDERDNAGEIVVSVFE